MEYKIGDKVVDEDGCFGYVVIKYSDGDICYFENDAAHPNPVVVPLDSEDYTKGPSI